MLVDFTLWTYLLLLSIGIFSTWVAAFKPSHGQLKKALMAGLFLAVFDFLFENAGAMAGLWFSSGAPLYLWAVPIQVFFIALIAGAAFHVVLPARKDALYIVSTSLLIAVIGAGIESVLLDHGLLTYMGGWTSTHAVVSYMATFMMVHIVNLKLSGHRVLHDNHESGKKEGKVKTSEKTKKR